MEPADQGQQHQLQIANDDGNITVITLSASALNIPYDDAEILYVELDHPIGEDLATIENLDFEQVSEAAVQAVLNQEKGDNSFPITSQGQVRPQIIPAGQVINENKEEATNENEEQSTNQTGQLSTKGTVEQGTQITTTITNKEELSDRNEYLSQLVNNKQKHFNTVLPETSQGQNVPKTYRIILPEEVFKNQAPMKPQLKVPIGQPGNKDTSGKNESFRRRGRRTATGDELKCDICGKQYTKKKLLTVHKRYHSDYKPFKCTVEGCNMAFKLSNGLSRHMRSHTNTRPYKCRYCDKAFTQSGCRKLHEMRHRGEKPYKCDVCGAAFVQSGSLKNHMEMHETVCKYKCDVCGNLYKHSKALIRHRKQHDMTKDYQCPYCWRDYWEKYDLKRHLQICKQKNDSITNEEIEKILEEKIRWKVNLNEEENTEKEGGEEKIELQENVDVNLENEEMAESGVLLHPCDICGKEFNNKYSAHQHKIKFHIMPGKKGFLCEFCGMKFHKRLTMENHVKVHMGVRNYECSICNKKFTTSSMLNNHFRIHFNDRPFSCKVCNRGFKVKNALKRHMFIHIKDSPLNCEYCGKPSTDRTNKLNHLKVHFGRIFDRVGLELPEGAISSSKESIQFLHRKLFYEKNIPSKYSEQDLENVKETVVDSNSMLEGMFREIVEAIGAEKRMYNCPISVKDLPKIGIKEEEVYIQKPIIRRKTQRMKINIKNEIDGSENEAEINQIENGNKKDDEEVKESNEEENQLSIQPSVKKLIKKPGRPRKRKESDSETEIIEKKRKTESVETDAKSNEEEKHMDKDSVTTPEKDPSSSNITAAISSKKKETKWVSLLKNSIWSNADETIQKKPPIKKETIETKKDNDIKDSEETMKEVEEKPAKNALEKHVELLIDPEESEIISVPLGGTTCTRSGKSKSEGIAKSYFCSQCDRGFYLKHLLDDHEIACRGNKMVKPFKCENCSRSFATRKSYTEHIKIHTVSECPICNKKFKTTNGKDNHMSRYHKNNDETSPSGKDKSPVKGKMKKSNYKMKVKLDSSVASDDKEDSSNSEEELSVSKTVERAKSEDDLDNSVNLDDQPSIDENKSSTIMEEQIKNEMDNKSIFPRRGSRRKSTLSKEQTQNDSAVKTEITSPESKDKLISESNDQLRNKPFASENVRISSRRPYKCGECGRSFSMEQELRKHINFAHLINVTYTICCTICDKYFRTVFAKDQHMSKFHSKTKDYICDFCRLGFADVKELRKHEKMHPESGKYTCPQCEFAPFSTKTFFLSHIEHFHAMSRPFRCSACMAGFRTSEEADYHSNSDECRNK